MRLFHFLTICGAVALLAGCSTPDSRIARNQPAFNGYPPAVQQKIRAGQVDLGFTPEMVRLALGEPARRFDHQAENGTTELWVYHDSSPRFSFGFGVGTFGRHSATSVGVSTTTGGGYDRDEKMRVEFRDGRVTAIEYARH